MDILKERIQDTVNLYKLQKFSEAKNACLDLLRNNPNISFLHNLMGLILTAQNKIEESIDYYKSGIKINSNDAMIHINLGSSYRLKKDYVKAEESYKKSIIINNNLPEAYNNLGNLYMDLKKNKKAINSFKQSILTNSKFHIPHYNLAILYKSTGEFKLCEKSIRKVIELAKDFYPAHRILSQIKKYKKSDNHINIMKTIYDKKDISLQGKIDIAFALGKVFDDLKDYKKAYKYYTEGNNYRKKNINFSLKEQEKEFENIKKVFAKNIFKKENIYKNKQKISIFILGMPRSGTTLVEQIISNHPDVYGGDELDYFNNLIKNYFFKNDIFSEKSVEDNLKSLELIGNEYVSLIKKLSNNSARVTDKLPINFKWIGFIKTIFPEAKIIHCKRNAKDTCLSVYKNYFTNTDLNYAYDLNDLVGFFNLYKEIMSFWKKLYPSTIIDVEYESLIKKPNYIIKSLVKKCDLTWNNNCLKFYNNKRIIKTASDVQARSKIYTSSIGLWKNYKPFLDKTFLKLVD